MTTDFIMDFDSIIFLRLCAYTAALNLIIGFFILLYHFWRTTDLYNRILTLDVFVIIGLGFIIVYSHISGFYLYIDVAVALSLVGFLATIALSRYAFSRISGR